MAELLHTRLINDVNLISYYRLDDINDSKGANTLTNFNSVTFSPAKYGNGADFSSNNTNKKLTTGNNLGIAGNGAISISFWIKMYNNSTAQTFIFFNSTTTVDRDLQIYYGGSNDLNFNGAGSVFGISFSDTLFFHHIVITRSSGGAIVGYLDGAQVVSFSAGTSGIGTNNFELADTNGVQFGNIILDDVAIFNRVLTIQEVKLLYLPQGGLIGDI